MRSFWLVVRELFRVFLDTLTFLRLCLRPTAAVAAENLFLRKQLGFYVERKLKPRRATNSIRFALSQLSRWFNWVEALVVVQSDTLTRWHRRGFRLFWKWKSRPRGRPAMPRNVRQLIIEMAANNATWGEERIADELLLKIGISISPRTVRRYMPKNPKRPRAPSQSWTTFVHNHAKAIIASDFFVVATATFRLVYVFVIIEVATRRILHFNTTGHPTAAWTLQQFRECVTGDEGYKFVIHDRDSIYSRHLDASLRSMGLTALKTPCRSPQANAICERLIGSARRECLDFMIPLNEDHVRQILKLWAVHYNRGRPHRSLGPGLPEPSAPKVDRQISPHRIPEGHHVVVTSVLGGLHHEYKLEKIRHEESRISYLRTTTPT